MKIEYYVEFGGERSSRPRIRSGRIRELWWKVRCAASDAAGETWSMTCWRAGTWHEMPPAPSEPWSTHGAHRRRTVATDPPRKRHKEVLWLNRGRTTERHLPYGITQRYLPPDLKTLVDSRRSLPKNRRYSPTTTQTSQRA